MKTDTDLLPLHTCTYTLFTCFSFPSYLSTPPSFFPSQFFLFSSSFPSFLHCLIFSFIFPPSPFSTYPFSLFLSLFSVFPSLRPLPFPSLFLSFPHLLPKFPTFSLSLVAMPSSHFLHLFSFLIHFFLPAHPLSLLCLLSFLLSSLLITYIPCFSFLPFPPAVFLVYSSLSFTLLSFFPLIYYISLCPALQFSLFPFPSFLSCLFPTTSLIQFSSFSPSFCVSQ